MKHLVCFFSAITGYKVPVLLPEDCKVAAKFQLKQNCTRHIIFTAETHNFPTGKTKSLIYIVRYIDKVKLNVWLALWRMGRFI